MTASLPGVDRDGIERWFARELGAPGPLRFARLGEGRSNLTYAVTDARGGAWVLRRPPLGTLLATANDVLREGAVIAGVRRAGVPAPPVHGLEEDVTVIGAPFVVLGRVEGTVLRDEARSAAVPAAVRQRAGVDLLDALVALHRLAPEDAGLGHLARPGAYVDRQLRRWRRQWDATATPGAPVTDDLVAWLEAHVPAQQAACLVHGDPKLDNCILGPDGRLLALVDWELAAVGDPLADLAMLLAYWAEPGDRARALQRPPTVVEGFPTRAELTARYAAGSPLDLAPLPYYLAFTYWKLACIVQGVYRRLLDDALGSSGPEPEPFRAQVHRLVELARQTVAVSGR